MHAVNAKPAFTVYTMQGHTEFLSLKQLAKLPSAILKLISFGQNWKVGYPEHEVSNTDFESAFHTQNLCSSLRVPGKSHYTAWCSEIGSLTSLSWATWSLISDVREPISLHKAVFLGQKFFQISFEIGMRGWSWGMAGEGERILNEFGLLVFMVWSKTASW